MTNWYYRAIYEFKFVCKKAGQPRWNEYPPGHHFKQVKGKNQGGMYQEVLWSHGSQEKPVLMWKGFVREP